MMRKKARIAAVALALLTGSVVLGGCGETNYTAAVNSESVVVTESEEKEDTFEITEATVLTLPGKREETVEIEAEADGTPKKVTVETRLSKLGDGDAIRDLTTLSDVKNREGDEEWIVSDGEIFWQNLGEDITYEGEIDRALPVGVSVTYYLDGTEVSADELAGKSGHVRIRFDYENRETYEGVTVPFVCVSGAILPEETFSNVEVKNGRVLSFGDTAAAVGLALPGLRESLAADGADLSSESKLPEYVEIEADATEFELSFTATLITNGLFSEEDEEDNEELKDELSVLLGVEVPDFSELLGQDEDVPEIDVSRESAAIRNGLSALSQEIMMSPTLSDVEKAAMLNDLSSVGNSVKSLGNKLSGLGETFSDSFAEYEDLSDALDDFKTRRDAIKLADRSYTTFAAVADEETESSVRFLLETEEIKGE